MCWCLWRRPSRALTGKGEAGKGEGRVRRFERRGCEGRVGRLRGEEGGGSEGRGGGRGCEGGRDCAKGGGGGVRRGEGGGGDVKGGEEKCCAVLCIHTLVPPWAKPGTQGPIFVHPSSCL